MSNKPKGTIYLDVCTMCRPFDNQNIIRNRLETDGYYLILQALQDSNYSMIVSPVHWNEIDSIRDATEKAEVAAIMKKYGKKAECDLMAARERADYLCSKKFGVADAAHIAFAEATSDFFVSCDDKLIKKCKREEVNISAVNPVEFCIMESLK